MFKKTTICLISAAALAVAQTTLPAGSKPTPGNCPGDCTGGSKKARDVCFAPDGGFTGARLFARNDWVRVSVCGNYPTGTVFRVSMNEQVVDEAALSTLASIEQLSKMGTPPAGGQETAAQGLMSLSVADLTTLAPLKTAEDNATKLQTLANSLGAAFQSVTKDLRDLNEADNSTTRQGAASRLLADLAAVKSLQVNDDTVSLGGNSDPAATAAALRKRDSELQAFSLSDAMKQVSRINLSQSEAQAVGTETSHEMQHDTIAAANSSKIEWYAQLMASFNTISKSAQVLAANCTVLGTVVGDWHEARTVGLQLQSAAASDPTNFQTVGTGVTLVMGQPVFAISGGFAISPLAKTTFQTLGASSSGSSGSSSGTIGLQENSSTRVQPMAFINASLVDGTTSWLKGSLHMTAGFTLTNNQLSTNPEFLFGPSLSFLRERLFFTGGVYGGFQQSLQAGYTLGGPAPSGTIPTVNQFHWRPGFAISWRVVSASKTNDNSSTTNPKTASQNPTTAKPKTGGGTGGGN